MAIRFNTAKQVDLAAGGVLDLTVLEIRTGTQPASANTAASGTLLATITGLTWNVSANPATSIGAPNIAAVATGVAGWGRFRNVGDTKRMDGVAGVDFTLADPNVVQNGMVTLTAASLTQPSGE